MEENTTFRDQRTQYGEDRDAPQIGLKIPKNPPQIIKRIVVTLRRKGRGMYETILKKYKQVQKIHTTESKAHFRIIVVKRSVMLVPGRATSSNPRGFPQTTEKKTDNPIGKKWAKIWKIISQEKDIPHANKQRKSCPICKCQMYFYPCNNYKIKF